MNKKDQKVQKTPLFDVFMASVKSQPRLYRATLPITLLIVIVKDLYLYCGGMPKNMTAYYVVVVLMALLLIYLICSFIYVSDRVLHNKPVRLRESFAVTAQRILQIYGICIFVIAFCIGFYYLGHYLVTIWAPIQAKPTPKYLLIILVFTIFPALYGIVVCLFAPVLVLLRNNNMFSALKNSVSLVWFH